MPTLEELPVELRIQILFNIDDFNSLQSLVFASPEYHQAYQIVRYDILFMLLRKSYDSLVDIQDAIAAIRSKGMYAVHPSNREKIIALLDARRRSDEIRYLDLSYSQVLPDKPADVVEVIQLLHLHDSAIFLLDDYCTSAECPQWMESIKWHGEILPLQLSRTEKRRFIRAFYRLQTYGNIFGGIEIPLGAKTPAKENMWFGSNWDCTDYTFTDEEFWRLFLAPMAPWEVEELGCFWYHCLKRWVKPCTEISDSLLNSGKMNGTIFITELPIHEQPPVYRYIWDTDDLAIKRHSIQDSLVSMGPSFLVRILREPDFMTRRNLLLINAHSWCHPFPDFWLRPEDDNGALPLLYPADKFNFGTDFLGLVELLDSLPDHERPNLAWRQRWLGNALEFPEVFEDMFNYSPRHPRWKWGYAFWDDERIIQWGTPNMENRFPGNDP